MAGASMNDIKARIKSVSGTMQITRAMELVATSKLRLAKEKCEAASHFADAAASAVKKLGSAAECNELPWFKENRGGKALYIVIAGDRGLAGGFNSNIFKLQRNIEEGESVFLPIGKKALEYCKRRGKEIYDESYSLTQSFSVGAGINIAERVTADFADGKISKVIIIYTEFVSMLTQTPKEKTLLPLEEAAGEDNFEPILEGDPEEFLHSIIKDLIGGEIYSAACKSYASELAARRTAMNSANKNAEEMIGSLMLKFNRARQAVITQEITEIVSGAEAL